MRWYVSSNGETVGPVEDQQVAAWVVRGMTDAMVRDELSGQWMQLRQSPFGAILPKRTIGVGRRIVTALIYGAVGAILAGVLFGVGPGLLAGVVGTFFGFLLSYVRIS